ncbi:MAG: hypothetical protein RSB20_06185, partial [Clostridia bacterium]
GKCVKDNPNLFRNITIDVSAQKPKVNFTADNATGLVSITSYYIGVTSTIISVNYEEFDELSNVWTKCSASFAQTVNAKPAKIYSGALCVNDNGKYKPVYLHDNFRIGQTINITACEYSNNESYVPIEQDIKVEFSAKAFKDNIAQEFQLDEYLTIKPLPNAANTFEVTCLKLPPMGVWVMIYAQTKLQTCRYQCEYITFAKTFNSNMQIAIDGTSIYSGIISLHPNSASKLVFNAVPTTSGQHSFDFTTVTNDKIRIYEAPLNENSAKKDATEFFVIEKLTGKEFGYSITPKSNCPTKPMSISLYIENPNEYFQTDNINVIAGDIFLVDSSGFVIDEISLERDGTAKSYYFSDSNGTVTGDRVKNIAVTGVDCGVDIFENYFSVYHKSQTLVDKTANIVLTLKDDTVYTFNMKFDDLYKGRDIVLVNKNGVEIND